MGAAIPILINLLFLIKFEIDSITNVVLPVPGPPSMRIKLEYSNNPNILFKSFSFLNLDLSKLFLILFESFCSISSNLLFHFIQDNFEFLNIIGEFIDSINPVSLKAF